MARILVADDIEPWRELFHEVLEGEGFEVVLAADGQEALDLFRSAGPFDLLILDGDMPRLGGREVLERLRAQGERIPALLVSGTLQLSASQVLALKVSVLVKPVMPSALTQEVRRLLDLSPGP
jgi:CheY-like chemotaxis protein